jgi:hypothetical protein
VSTASKWLLGCGVGCGCLVLLIVAFFVVIGLFVRETVGDLERASESDREIEARFGDAETIAPWPLGAVPPERVEAFLRVREATAPPRAALERSIAGLPDAERARELERKPTFEKLVEAWSIGRGAFGLVREMGDLMQARDRAMLAEGIGPREYALLYATVYHGYLGHPLDAGPRGVDPGAGDGAEADHFLDVPTARRRAREALVRALEDQLAVAESKGPWARVLEAEIAALAADADRRPFADGLPETTSRSLEPYRSRCEATFSAVTHPFELARSRKEGSVSFRLD